MGMGLGENSIQLRDVIYEHPQGMSLPTQASRHPFCNINHPHNFYLQNGG